MLDPRRHPYRPDLAAAHLREKIDSPRYVEARDYVITAPIAPLFREPHPQALRDTEALQGERIAIYDINDEGWAWGQLRDDGYVGWVSDQAIDLPAHKPTHRVSALRTFSFPGPSIKLAPLATLTLGSKLAIVRTQDNFCIDHNGIFYYSPHLASVDACEADYVSVAERFLETPYLWGGKSSLGIDCSGLVQTALSACGIAAPRDSDMQEAELGNALMKSETRHLRRGDLIFWKGHVAIARDATTLIHANAHHLCVTIEPIEQAVSRIAMNGSEITSIKRFGTIK